MKLKLKYILPVALALLSLSSCEDFLNKVPDTRVELNTPEQLRLLLVNGYTSANYALVGEFSSDNVIDNNSPNDQGVRYNLGSYSRMDDEIYAWEDVVSGTGNDSPSDIWESCYKAIACANAVLERIPYFESIGKESEVKAIKAEAYLIRAYHHFILANIFCMPYRGPELSKTIQGIPYPTEPETTVLVKYDRGNLADVYDKIEADLLEGLKNVDNAIYEVPKYHFNKAAANAFAARFYLFKRDYEKVITYANVAFGGEGVDPAPYMSELWSQTTLYYLADFGRYYTNIIHQRNLMLISTYSSFVRHFGGYRYTCNREAKRATIQGPGPTWENCKYRNSQSGETFAMNPCFQSTSFTAGGQEYGTYFGANCAEQFEYSDKVAGIGYAHIVRSEFNGEETLLCRAEAKIFTGDLDGAIKDLKVWDDARKKNNAGDDRTIDMTKDAVVKFYSKALSFGIANPINLDEICPSDKYSVTAENLPYVQCIQHLRRIETIHTGLRWFDLKRFGIEITHKIGKDGVKTLTKLDPRRAIQIPTEALSAGLEANYREVLKPSGESSNQREQLVKN
ncbi:MAG: RagB/SusD family nutrient uptake outer membrane protein [Muribaculaceae bacterium]|nr:RagB/SusD family nutrient uptake outer membrane protein [Muribaculaceae bacterium]